MADRHDETNKTPRQLALRALKLYGGKDMPDEPVVESLQLLRDAAMCTTVDEELFRFHEGCVERWIERNPDSPRLDVVTKSLNQSRRVK